jgi:tetratricopeptide (TPR) repeat protein
VRRRRRAACRFAVAALAAVALLAAGSRPAAAQEDESPAVLRALDLENAGKYREAAALFRAALRASPSASALLGLERAYAELGMSDSLLAPLDTLIARRPRDPIYRSVQLRTLQILRREDGLRAAFERWVRDVPRDPAPFREYARLLLQLGRSAAADSVVQRGRAALGGARDLEYETAQLRAAQGQWMPSAQAWRRAVADAPHLAGAAAYALAPTPSASRDSIRAVLLAPPAEAGARSALAELELAWGRPRDAWDALRMLPRDTASARIWSEFGERALAEERYTVARDALAAALGVRRTPALALSAARAALRAGSPADVATLAPLSDADADPAHLARDYVPLHVEALAALGRGADAEAVVQRYDRHLAPGQRIRLARTLATAWVRAGDLPRARAALRAAGEDADSSEAAGWLALYEGRLGAARALLKGAREPGPELAPALGLVARTRGDSAPELGAAFLALARGDSAGAAARFVEAADRHPEAASAIVLAAARVLAARGDEGGATALWRRVVTSYADSPEAAESELEWARLLRRKGDAAAAVAHLEHLILSAPQSALLPQARRELELARGTIPPS